MAQTLYTQNHEWITIDGDTGTVGITTHAAESLGDITYVELPEVGAAFAAGAECAVAESSKAAADIYMPMAGTIAAVNDALADDPETMNTAPESDGWVCKVRLDAPADHAGLMDAQAYKKFIAEL